MTPKEKAEELVYDMYRLCPASYTQEARACALLAVNEILNAFDDLDLTSALDIEEERLHYGYWINVQQELKGLENYES
jgi:hypothetical protein